MESLVSELVSIFLKPGTVLMFQKIKQSTERQRELEADQVKTFDKLNNARTHKPEEVPSLQVRLLPPKRKEI